MLKVGNFQINKEGLAENEKLEHAGDMRVTNRGACLIVFDYWLYDAMNTETIDELCRIKR